MSTPEAAFTPAEFPNPLWDPKGSIDLLYEEDPGSLVCEFIKLRAQYAGLRKSHTALYNWNERLQERLLDARLQLVEEQHEARFKLQGQDARLSAALKHIRELEENSKLCG
uniref:Uncharacterized protein n=1 Tax=Mycena chlorophos TaxID=658473 RepID=A0ABQ0L7V2_MYCCL|nr:predicted protein [Mycena chlorophos]